MQDGPGDDGAENLFSVLSLGIQGTSHLESSLFSCESLRSTENLQNDLERAQWKNKEDVIATSGRKKANHRGQVHRAPSSPPVKYPACSVFNPRLQVIQEHYENTWGECREAGHLPQKEEMGPSPMELPVRKKDCVLRILHMALTCSVLGRSPQIRQRAKTG